MNVEDFNYRATCQACDGSGNLPSQSAYPDRNCPACDDGWLNRLEDAHPGYIRLSEEYHDQSGHVTHEEIPISDEENGGFEERYGDESIHDAIDRLRSEGDEHTAEIFHNILNDLHSPFDIVPDT